MISNLSLNTQVPIVNYDKIPPMREDERDIPVTELTQQTPDRANTPPFSKPHKSLRDKLRERRALEQGISPIPLEQVIFNGTPEQPTVSTEESEPKTTEEKLFKLRSADILEKIHDSITDRERKILELIEEGLDNDQIAQSLGLSRKHTDRIMTQLRHTSENEFLYPHGFMRVKPLGATFEQAAIYDRLLHVEYMRMNYTTEDAKNFYLNTRKGSIPKSLEKKGVVSLWANTNQNEYYMLKARPNFAERIIMINGIACINTSDLEEFRTSLQPASVDEKPLTELVESPTERLKIYHAIKRGRIKTDKRKHQHHLTPEALDAYYASVPDHYKGRNKKKTD